jgi:hypothetical protein
MELVSQLVAAPCSNTHHSVLAKAGQAAAHSAMEEQHS